MCTWKHTGHLSQSCHPTCKVWCKSVIALFGYKKCWKHQTRLRGDLSISCLLKPLSLLLNRRLFVWFLTPCALLKVFCRTWLARVHQTGFAFDQLSDLDWQALFKPFNQTCGNGWVSVNMFCIGGRGHDDVNIIHHDSFPFEDCPLNYTTTNIKLNHTRICILFRRHRVS